MGTAFDILESSPAHNELTRSVIKIPESSSPNDLLQYLIGETQVFGFTEKIPTINDIFISTVKGENHE
jgi:ABC-2 type transport system ATP-binding protein